MNIKLHTPKSLKMGSGMSSLKQFLLSLFATSVSIALTFGTAAVIDYNAKQKEKREIVMMVMYDMYNTLQWVEKNDSLFHEAMLYQKRLAENPAEYNIINTTITMAHSIPSVEYTETTERIFSTSIETINTVGNVLFTEMVAEFYQSRTTYKTLICDSLMNNLKADPPFHTLQGAIDFDVSNYAIIGCEIKVSMQQMFDQCKQMMNVSDEEIEIYQKERQKIKKEIPIDDEARKKKYQEIIQLQKEIQDAKKKLKFE
jgi:hypothetical protein